MLGRYRAFLYNFLRRYQPIANRIKGITVEIGGDTTEQLQNGEISQEQYGALQREIAETEVFNNSRCHTINRYSVQDCVVWEVLL